MISWLQRVLWPIHRDELRRFVPLFILGFLICFNYSLLRCLKDTVVVIPSTTGAGVLPFLKMWGVLPAVLMLAVVLSFLFRKLPRSKVFYLVTGTFLLYFLLFALVIYPCRNALTLDKLATFLSASLPSGFAAPIEVIQQWPLSLFYVMAELWKVAILMVLFWGFVNSQTTLQEATRLYGPLTVGGSLAGVAAGQVAVSVAHLQTAWHEMLFMMIALVVVVGIGCLALYAWSDRIYRGTQPEKIDPHAAPIKKVPGPKTVMEALKLVLRSRVLVCISLMIIGEYIAFNLVEVVWKEQMKLRFPSATLYCAYTGKVMIWTGIAGAIGSLLIANHIIRLFGWTAAALFTPCILLLTSLLFYGFTLQGGEIGLEMAVFFGAVHNVLCRAARQALSDPAKEMAYLPLPTQLQTQGKTFVDGVSPTLGKTGGSLLQQGLLVLFPSISATIRWSALLVFLSIFAAGSSVLLVGKRFRQKLAQVREKAPAKASAPATA
ncbi:MAG: hypothetical protein JSR80_04010 [Verrucomicrobia bacterium]|nr:hypothetical protein [Verrucomicrobiota bacterium]